jgi:hypothetical protein
VHGIGSKIVFCTAPANNSFLLCNLKLVFCIAAAKTSFLHCSRKD